AVAIRAASAREAEDALRDYVALDLRRAAHDGLRARVEVLAREGSVGERVPTLGERGVRSEDVRRHVLQTLVGLAAEHLLDRALDSRLSGTQEPRQAAVSDQTQQLYLDVRLRQALADHRIRERAARTGVLAREAHELLEAAPDLALEREGPDRAAFV